MAHRGRTRTAGEDLSLVGAAAQPVRFAGVPLAHWLFGLRTWLAMMLALYVAFWMQLDGASSAAVTVGILALPTRGQVFGKALYRVIATVIGVVASIVMAGLFNEIRTLFVVALAGWLALCVFAAGWLDGDRASAAVLSGFTVAIVAMANIDSPQDTFSSSINRGAAIMIGIVAVTLVSDLFRAPDLLPTLLGKIDTIHRDVKNFALRTLESDAPDPVEVARLFGRISALRADVVTLPLESIAGRTRAAAARQALSALVGEVRAARILASTFQATGEDRHAWRARIAEALHGGGVHAEKLLDHCASVIHDQTGDVARLIAARGATALITEDRRVVESLCDVESGRGPGRGPGLPVYHSGRAAARNALRVFIAVLLSATVLVLSGWPSTTFALVLVAALASIAATTPNPWRFAVGTLIAMPVVAAVAGVTEFIVLDGVDAFPLLAIAMLVPIMVCCLLMTSGNPKLMPVGTSMVFFLPLVLSPSNPQSYDPQSFLTTSVLCISAAIILAVALATLLPTSDGRRRRWMLGAVRRECRDAVAGRPIGRQSDPEASFQAADRLGQLAGLAYRDDAERIATLSHALHLTELTFSAMWVRSALADLDPGAAEQARSAMAALDPLRLRTVAGSLGGAFPGRPAAAQRAAAHWAAADMARTAALIERYAADIGLAHSGALP